MNAVCSGCDLISIVVHPPKFQPLLEKTRVWAEGPLDDNCRVVFSAHVHPSHLTFFTLQRWTNMIQRTYTTSMEPHR